jgi:uncharacterized membrane protein YphA (DoxX/SURF4 family)
MSVRGVLRLLLGGLLLAAGLSKVGDGWAFAETIANFRLLPAAGNQIAAVAIPWWEVAAGVLLVLNLWVRPTCWLASGLFLGFATAVASALARGLDIACGCFGTGVAGRVGVPLLLIDLTGMALALFLLRTPRRETGGAAAPVPAQELF